jgi:Tol biopolymer transport system component
MRAVLAPFAVLALALSLPASAAEVKLLSSVPANRASGTASGSSRVAALSADGRWVAFSSDAPNLLPGIVDENGGNDVFLHDRGTGETILVSRSVEDEERTAGRPSTATSISADGRYLAFVSLASDLVPGQVDPGGWDFFLYDRVTGRTELVSHKPRARATAANQSVGAAVVSADGRWVAFASASRELTAATSTGLDDLFLWERRTGEVRLITRSAAVSQFLPISSSSPALSADGRYVTFYSNAPDLAPGQGETESRSGNVFLFDRVTGKTVLADHAASSPAVGNGAASSFDPPRITPDGRFVVYTSGAKNLVAGLSGPPATTNVFLYERATGKNVLVSRAVSSPTISGDGTSFRGYPSADGSSVLFTSTSANLVAGQTGAPGQQQGVFLYTRSTGRISLVSGAGGSATTTADGSSWSLGLSGDGGTALFESQAEDVVAGVTDDNDSVDLFVWDRRTGEAELVSHGAASAATAAATSEEVLTSSQALLSNDGKWIAFNTLATDMAAGVRDTNGLRDVVLQGRTGGRTLLSRRDPARPSSTPGGASRAGGVSADGRYAVFVSTAADLLPGTRDKNRASDVYLADRVTGAQTLVSRSAAAPGIPASGAASKPRISADGRFVAYVSTASDVIPGQLDTEEESPDVFLWDRTTGSTSLVSRTPASPVTAGTGTNPVISADGAVVAFESHGDELVPGQAEGHESFESDVFLWDRATGTTLLVSRALGTAATTGNAGSYEPSLDASGRYVAFTSGAKDLVASGSEVAYKNIFLFDRIAGTTVLASPVDVSTGAGGGFFPVLSPDGRFVAYLSGGYDLYLWDRTAGASRLVGRSAGFTSNPVDGLVILPGFSADGRFLVFASSAPDLVPGQQDGSSSLDVFLHDRETGKNVLVSRVGSATRTPSQGAFSPVISADGRFVVFLSRSGDLAGGSGTIPQSVFRFDRQTGAVTLVSRALAGPGLPANGLCQDPAISADGTVVTFSSFASDLVARDLNRSPEGPLQDAFAAVFP